jgi:hypothetical protein
MKSLIQKMKNMINKRLFNKIQFNKLEKINFTIYIIIFFLNYNVNKFYNFF